MLQRIEPSFRPYTCGSLSPENEAATRDVLGRMSGKWPMWVVHVLAEAGTPMRFTRVSEAVEGITQKVLTQTLRSLERDGFVSRRIYPAVPPRVEYALTDLGRDLLDFTDPLIAWTRRKVPVIEAAQRRYDEAVGR